MDIVTIQQATKDWERLLERVETGEELILARDGRLIAKLVALRPDSGAPQPHKEPPRDLGD